MESMDKTKGTEIWYCFQSQEKDGQSQCSLSYGAGES